MLTFIDVSIKNNLHAGSVEVVSNVNPNVESIENTFSIVISRRNVEKGSWTDLYTKEVATIDDLNFKVVDILTVSGTTYNYNIDIIKDGEILESQVFDNIECYLEGLFIGNFEKYYIAGSSFKTDYKRNRIVEYVTTLASTYPYSVSNGAANYVTGTSTGLFLKVTSDGKKFEKDLYSNFTNEVLSFLTDGTEKILKTHDGNIWYVSIDGTPQQMNSGYWGVHEIQFSWTEIGEVPNTGMLIEAGE